MSSLKNDFTFRFSILKNNSVDSFSFSIQQFSFSDFKEVKQRENSIVNQVEKVNARFMFICFNSLFLFVFCSLSKCTLAQQRAKSYTLKVSFWSRNAKSHSTVCRTTSRFFSFFKLTANESLRKNPIFPRFCIYFVVFGFK